MTAIRAAVAGVLVGALLAIVVARAGGPDEEAPGPTRAGAEAFLAAWARSRTATYVAEGRFTRTFDGRAGLSGEVRTAQRPPDRLEVSPGAASGRLGGHRLACAETDGELACRIGEAVGPYDEAVEREVQILREQVVGPARLYDVTAEGDGCFTLALARRYPAPPYGTEARWCFDAATGAVRASRIDRGRAVDTVEVDTIRPDVTDADLRPAGSTGQG